MSVAAAVKLDGRRARRARGQPRLESLYADLASTEARIRELTQLAEGAARIGRPERFFELRTRIRVLERRRAELERDITWAEVTA